MTSRLTSWLSLVLVCVLAMSACGSLPDRPSDVEPSYRLPTLRSATLNHPFDGHEAMDSGVMLLSEPEQALLARLALIDSAQRSIDAQYYIWAGDAVGALLLERLVLAADRGVRVRLLVDDTSIFGSGKGLMSLHDHANVEIRSFNPFRFRMRHRPIRRTIDILAGAARLNHRMHNKLIAVDNAAAVVGGRNLATEYFGGNPKRSFRDLDVLTIGPVVDDISAGFDDYWNSQWAYPLSSLSKVSSRASDLIEFRARLTVTSAELTERLGESQLSFDNFLAGQKAELIWSEVEVVADSPTKILSDQESPVVSRLRELGGSAANEILIENAYFIPGTAGTEVLRQIRGRGVSIKVLTNSLGSNDAGVSHAGYKKYRKGLLQADIDLFELRSDAALRSTFTLSEAVKNAGLHSKAATFDRQVAFIGSFNLDPRSAFINTEVALIIHDAEFAGLLADFIEAGMQPDNSWQLSLTEADRLQWQAEQVRKREPPAGLKKRIVALLLGLLPVERQL